MARIYKCPDCGKVYDEQSVPLHCKKCGTHRNVFNVIGDTDLSEKQKNALKEEEKATMAQSTIGQNKPQYKYATNTDEKSVRVGAGIVFAFFIIFSFAGIIFGIVLLTENHDISIYMGIITILVSLINLLIGWIIRAFIRLFANMSERLTNIDVTLSNR